MSSIQRQHSADAADAARQREPAERTPPKREPPAPDTVDRFRSALQQVREQPARQPLPQGGEAVDTHESLLTQSARSEAQAVARAEGQAGDDARGAHSALSEVVEDSARRRGDDLGTSASSLPSADASLLWQAQMALRDTAPAQAPTAPAGNAQAFADLIERHVRQLAADGAARDGEGRVLLRMSDATLPGTDLLLSRGPDGWTLRADVRSRTSFDAIREAAPELAKRFAERNLGALHIDPHFHG